jgi:hypothetical protein
MSQSLMAFHFAVVSLRSIDGRAWAFDQLRFEMQDNASASQQPRAPARRATMLEPIAAEVLQGDDRADDEGVLFRMRLALLTFQRRKFAKCRVFAIPCDECRNVLRPFFKLPFLKHLHRMADTHPFIYLGLITVVGFCSIMSAFFSDVGILSGSNAGILSLVLNTVVFVTFIGYLSSLRNNIDNAAAKHILLCFRFNYCVALIACWIGLYIRDVYLTKVSFWQFAAAVVMMLLFCFSLLTDCSPRQSAVVQFSISVSVCACPSSTVFYNLRLSKVDGLICFQAGWCTLFGHGTIVNLLKTNFLTIFDVEKSDAKMDCFIDFGAYSMCDATTLISIQSGLFMLSAQALVSRILTPGISIFVNASVSSGAFNSIFLWHHFIRLRS